MKTDELRAVARRVLGANTTGSTAGQLAIAVLETIGYDDRPPEPVDEELARLRIESKLIWELVAMGSPVTPEHVRSMTARRLRADGGAREDAPPDQGCTFPPPGWWCSREPGHEGPCAARPR